MKKKIMILAVGAVLALGAFALAGCASGNSADSGQAAGDAAAADDVSPSGEVSVYSREDGSGTRSAFIELMGVEEKDASGEKVDMTTPAAAITNSTSVMMTSVAGDPNGIGYISLGSLNDTVKAVEVDGVEATAENVKSGTYKVARPFNIVTKDGLSDVAQDFIDFILSADGQAIVEEEGYIAVEDGAAAYVGSGVSGKIVVAGSSSVTPVMEKLAEAYQAINSGVTIEVQQSDSTTGVNMAHRRNLRHRHGFPRAEGLRVRRDRHRHRPGWHRRHSEQGFFHQRPDVRPDQVDLHGRNHDLGRSVGIAMSRLRIKEGLARALFVAAAGISLLAVALICVFLFANGVPAIAQIGLS